MKQSPRGTFVSHKVKRFCQFLSHTYVYASHVTSTCSLFGSSLFLPFLFWPLLEEPRGRKCQGGSEGREGEKRGRERAKEDGVIWTDSGASWRPAGCALAHSDAASVLLNLPPLKAFKGNTLTAHFSSSSPCLYLSFGSPPPQLHLSAPSPSLRLICAPVIHEFISGTAQSCLVCVHMRMRVQRDVGLNGIRRRRAMGGGGKV